jgi:hypothetical protein
MSDIRIGALAQKLTLVGILAAIGAAIAAQLPEIQRYLKIRRM